MSLRYSLSSRRVLDAGTGVLVSRGIDLPGLVQSLDTLDLDRRTSSLAATGRWARAPRPSDALEERGGVRSDWSVFGSVEVATPPRVSTVEYVKLVTELSGLLPLTDAVAVRGRLGGGRVLPFGVSIPAPDGSDRLEAYLRLRDAVLTAGGSQDVRGWGSELLGPKAPDLRASDGDPVPTGRYLPLGGLARWTGSVQVEAPLPLVGSPHGLHAFLDAGRVWTPDGRFLPATGPVLPGQLGERVRYGTGLGVSLATPVGPVQLDLGYKLNPSALDLRAPAAVGRALLEGRPVESVPEDPIRRWHLHLSIGGVS